MLADIIRLRRSHMEATAERVVFEQQEWANSRHDQEALHEEFAEVSEVLRSELTVQATQAMDYCVQEENTYYRAHARSLEHQMEAKIAYDRSTLQLSFYTGLQKYKLELQPRRRLTLNPGTNIASTQHEQEKLRQELPDAAEQHGLEMATVNSLR